MRQVCMPHGERSAEVHFISPGEESALCQAHFSWGVVRALRIAPRGSSHTNIPLGRNVTGAHLSRGRMR